MSVRVLWLIKGLGPGGAENLLATAAEAHDGNAIAFECAYVIAQKDHLVERLEQAGVRCHCLAADGATWKWPWRLWRLLAESKFDVVHSHSPLPAAIGRLASHAISGPPALMTTEHNAWRTFSWPTRWANRVTMPLDDAVFAVSNEARSSMSQRLRQRCVALPHGIDVAAVRDLRTGRAVVREELGLDKSTFVVGTVANYREQKDYPNLLRAAAEWRDGGSPVHLVAIGQGPLEEAIRRLRDDLGLADVVTLLGYRSDATRLMAGFDVFTLASTWEGLPVALMDALALGLPIAATRVGGIAETLKADDALLVPPSDHVALANAWECLRTDAGLRRRLADKSAARGDQFDIARVVAQYESCYRTLAHERKGGDTDRSQPRSTSEPAPDPALRRRSVGLDIRAADEDDRPQILDLLTRTLGWGDDPRYEALFRWKHDDNPFGQSPMWVACDGDRIVGLRVFMRWQFVRGGVTVRAVRAVDTATDPEYQGRGLFTALTLHGLEQLQAEGVDFVFNTPNDQSLPGYLKMGWTAVGHVPAAFRIRNPAAAARTLRARVPADLWSSPSSVGVPAGEWLADRTDAPALPNIGVRELTTNTSIHFLRWRYASAVLGYRAVETGTDQALILRERRRGDAREMVIAEVLGSNTGIGDRAAASALSASRCDHALRAGRPSLYRGFLPLPAVPLLTFRALNLKSAPPLNNWALTLGDIELF